VNSLRAESTGVVDAAPAQVFAHLDDQARLSAHMTKSSWMMGGGRMELTADAGQFRVLGSKLRLAGSAFGIGLFLEEVVTGYEPPVQKTWETVGSPRLVVIGAYRMGFVLSPAGRGTSVQVWIDYSLPEGGISKLLGRFFAGMYARWCTRRMVLDAVRHFASNS
jgi:hypothetical protein